MTVYFISYKLLFFVLFFLLHPTLSNKFYLDSNNKFQDLLVFINDNVVNDDGALLNSIKDYINRSSMFLWKATSNMDWTKAGVQFGTVFIRVPESWTVDSIPITWQQCNTATFFVTKTDPSNEDNKPFTKQIRKCGDPGNFTRFPESFFRRPNTSSEAIKAGKEIMNEFVKLRYGVFSEKPYRNVLTVFDGVTFIKSTCGKDIEWILNQTPNKCMEPNSICSYSVIPNQNHNYSVMFDTESQESDFFCNDGNRPHNKYAKNLHNKMCNRRSVTNVILSHKDFVDSKPSKSFENVNFVVVKGQSRKIVLVLDTSISMEDKIDNMKKATVKFLETVEDSAQVGIVEFNMLGKLKSNLLSMKNSDNRNNLIQIINNLGLDSYTNIAGGLVVGVQALGGDITNDERVFGTIILLTDGESNYESPYTYESVINQIIKKKILVNAIAYGKEADAKITRLTDGTGGKYYFSDPNAVFLELFGKMSAKQTCELSVDHEIKIFDSNVEINILDKVQTTNLTYIDQFVGTNLKLAITVPPGMSNSKITLIDPNGKRFSSSQTITQGSGVTLTFHIPGIPMKGMYRIELSSSKVVRYKRSDNSFTLSFTISAKPQANSSRIINPTGELSLSEMEMLSEETTVQATVDLTTCGILKEENVTVYLLMDTPTKRNVVLNMTDDGIGDDTVENDKIYTKSLFAKDINEVGFYNFRAKVEIQNKKDSDIIRRSIELGSLRVKKKPTEKIQDKIPPSKIEDLIVTDSNYTTKRLTIKFTAPGNDGMDDNITNYEIMIRSSITVVQIVKINSTSRELVQHDYEIGNYNITSPFEISIRGIDDNNNMAEWSLPYMYNWNYTAIVASYKTPGSSSGRLETSCYYIFFCVFVIFY